MDRRAAEFDRIEESFEKAPFEDKAPWFKKETEITDRMAAIENAISSIQATTLAGAAVQLRVIGMLCKTTKEPEEDEVERNIRIMAASVRKVVEREAGVTRKASSLSRYAGEGRGDE